MSTPLPSSSWTPLHADIVNDIGHLLAWHPYDLPNRDAYLETALQLHGLRRSQEHPYDYWQMTLVSHLFNGLCSAGSGTACAPFHCYSSYAALCVDICRHVVRADPIWSIDALVPVCSALAFPVPGSRGERARPDIYASLERLAAQVSLPFDHPPLDFFFSREAARVSLVQILAFLRRHGVPAAGTRDQLFYSVFSHIVSGSCLVSHHGFDGCASVRDESAAACRPRPFDPHRHLLYVVDVCLRSEAPASVLKFLRVFGVPSPDASSALSDLLLLVQQLRMPLCRAVFQPDLTHADNVFHEREKRLASVRDLWPNVPSPAVKDATVSRFRSVTSSNALRSKPCASCGQAALCDSVSTFDVKEVDLTIFKPSGRRPNESVPFPLPFLGHSVLADVVLDPSGVTQRHDGSIVLHICDLCKPSVSARRMPRLALANGLYVGPVPDVLQDLSPIEETLIARARAKCLVVQLQLDVNSPARSPANQRALRGNVVVFPQHPEPLPYLLPPSIDEILEYVCVVFVGSELPPPEWFQQHAKPLLIRPSKVRAALEWLKEHNKLYENVRIDEDTLSAIPLHGMLPYHIELVSPTKQQASMTSGYVPDDAPPVDSSTASVPFPSLVVANIGKNVTSSEMRSAAIRHIKENRGAFIAVPHDPFFVNEFSNPHLFPSLYPTLFPYGVGGIEDAARTQRVSFENHVKLLLSLHDRRFQEHPSFLFTAFNIVQRRTMLRAVHFQSRRSWFHNVADELAAVSADSIQSVATYLKHMKDGASFFQPTSDDERLVQKLLYQVNYVSRGIPGTNSSRLAMRNEIRALIVSLGVPQLFITLNPSDVRNPIVKFLAGADIDIDNLSDADVPEYWAQSCQVAKNPFIAAKFFNLYIKAFITEILRWKEPSNDDFAEGASSSKIGIFGATRAFYGAVEAQGRGTLHVHMVVWLEGGLNPNELKERLLSNPNFAARFTAFAEDAISTSLPNDPGPDVDVQSNRFHACSLRGPDIADGLPQSVYDKDLFNVAEKVQTHQHKLTCYKYCPPPPAPQVCRFDLDPSFHIAESRIDPDSGEFTLRHLDGMVNNFNDTVLRALRNNMDIKIIGSGESAKAIVFYITDYISKSQLKIHVAFSALEQALRKLESSSQPLDDTAQKGKHILQKCAYEMLGRQEMSAPQVASVLMDYEDHFTSHQFRCLFWTSAEKFVENFFGHAPLNPSQSADVDVLLPAAAPQTEFRVDDAESMPTRETDTSAESIDGLGPDDEVIWEQDEDGELVPRASQLRDYLLRGGLLRNLSLWDFVSRVSKIRSSKNNPMMQSVHESEELFQSTNVLTCATSDRPKCRLLPAHDEYSSSYLEVSHPLHPFVPVLIGPALPRRDRPAVFEQYCRLMLIFFKPWSNPADLRLPHQTWEDAFRAFQESSLFTPDVNAKLANMQVFHECKDSRDEHYKKRRACGPGLSAELTDRDDVNVLIEDLSSGVDVDGDDRQFALMLRKLNATFSKREIMASERVAKVLEAAANAGIFLSPNMHGFEDVLAQRTALCAPHHVDVSGTDNRLEAIWKKAYRNRSVQWKSGFDAVDDDLPDIAPSDSPPVSFEFLKAPKLPTVIHLDGLTVSAKQALRDATARHWTLNDEQEYAYRIITDLVISPSDQPLKMLVTGPAGTGKTRIVDAVKDFFGKLGQDHRYLLASFMGIAAKNISGVTLHSALNLGKLEKMKAYGKMHQELMSLWEGKDWLVVDEVSMISLPLLYEINEGLQWAKESDLPFGGVNIVFLGDFAQLPPVAQAKLYSILEPAKKMNANLNAQKTAFGKLLWLAVDTVCFLTQIKRQEGDHNERFVELLGRLRLAECTDDDFALLNSRLLSENDVSLFEGLDSVWRSAPIIVSENGPKDALNEACAIQFALDHNRELHWYHSRDYREGKEILVKLAS